MKKLIGSDCGSYTFNPLTRQISLLDLPNIKLEQILMISNVTARIQLYVFADESVGTFISDNLITLGYDTTAMSSTDNLMILIDVPSIENLEAEQQGLDESYVIDTNIAQVLGSQPLVDNGRVNTNTLFTQNKVGGKIGSIGESIGINCEGMNTILIESTGIFILIAIFEGRGLSGTYQPISAIPLSGVAGVTYFGNTGAWRVNCAGLSRFQCRISAYTSGTAIVSLTASSAKVDAPPVSTIAMGSMSASLTQRASSFELMTFDTNLSSLGTSGLITGGIQEFDPVVAPTINRTMPTAYAPNNMSQYPQRLRRLRVQSGGSDNLPFAQELHTNRLIVSTPELFSTLQEVLMQLQLLNQNFSQVNNLNLPAGTQEIK